MANVLLSPGVKVTEVDQSQYTPTSNTPSNAFGIVGTGKFGPTDTPTVITSLSQFEKTFGISDDQSSLAAVELLRAGGTMYYVRSATDDAEKRSATITGTGGNLTMSAKYTGTITTGALSVKISAVANVAGSYNMTVAKKVGDVESTFINTTVISLNKESDNYYGKWQNNYFEIVAAGETDPTALTPGTYNFSDGNDGIAADMSATIATSLDQFSDPESISVIVLAAPFYSTNATVAKKLQDIADARKDLLAQIDHKIDASVSDITGIASTYASTYCAVWAGTPVITDPYTGLQESCVPSVAVLAGLARMYQSYPLWSAPAGASRFQLTNIIKLDHEWTLAERDTLYQGNVNPINNYKGLGYTAMGQKTTQPTASATDRINVRMLCNYIKTTVEEISAGFLFMPINEDTFNAWIYRVSGILSNIQVNNGLYDYTVKMDWETVTPDDLNNNRMPGIIQIKPTKVAEFITIDLIVKNYSDTF